MSNRKKFPDYERRCGWNDLLPPGNAQTVSADGHFDAVVVGAGFTGLAAARRFAQHLPQAKIAVLDAVTVGEGNPGRNSGFLLEVALAHDVDTANLQRMRRCNDLLQETMRRLANDAARGGCTLSRRGTYRAAAGKVGLRSLARYQEFLEQAGLPFEELDRQQLAARIGTNFYAAGLYSPHCYLMQPAALVRALCTLLPENVSVFENSPAVGIERSFGNWQVTTPAARLTSPRVFLANNAFCKGLGVGRSRLVAMYTYAALTKPVAEDVLADCGSDSDWGLLPAHRLGSTLRRTADNRFLIRSLYGYEREASNTAVQRQLRSSLLRRFPQLADLQFESVWSGATGFTFNAAPVWGQVEQGLYVSAGCNGGGVVKGTLLGGLLADLACGHETPDVAALFGQASWMPPEPFRRIGFELISRWERRKARAEV